MLVWPSWCSLWEWGSQDLHPAALLAPPALCHPEPTSPADIAPGCPTPSSALSFCCGGQPSGRDCNERNESRAQIPMVCRVLGWNLSFKLKNCLIKHSRAVNSRLLRGVCIPPKEEKCDVVIAVWGSSCQPWLCGVEGTGCLWEVARSGNHGVQCFPFLLPYTPL